MQQYPKIGTAINQLKFLAYKVTNLSKLIKKLLWSPAQLPKLIKETQFMVFFLSFTRNIWDQSINSTTLPPYWFPHTTNDPRIDKSGSDIDLNPRALLDLQSQTASSNLNQ